MNRSARLASAIRELCASHQSDLYMYVHDTLFSNIGKDISDKLAALNVRGTTHWELLVYDVVYRLPIKMADGGE